ncbi:SNW/SKI-interacting protein A isoform X2 [Abrus precatorius]|uniref:SNW/SKI-interacting protein A isoform X2 n=1 Tax=Abrus precatorius TaxID=3816 RepID=A0A8B8LSU1_ABRPR|nr:SNW/SKI-interacting protein A isoform X2 [Abrus precatorius]
MAALKELLPPAKSSSTTYYDHTNDPWFKQRFSSSDEEKTASIKLKPVPPYLKRAGFVPRKIEDFGDGGAFPEIHVAQYPLDMGRDKASKPVSKILPVTVDAHGNVAYDAIVRQNENAKKIVYTQQKDLIPKILKNDDEDLADVSDDEEMQKEVEETMQDTKAALEKIVNVRLSAAQPKNVPTQNSDTKYIKYKPSQQSAAFNSGAKERVIRMVEMPVDPLEPPKFKHKRVPKASGSPPVPVMHSPPRPVTVKDQQDWKIPPCISNWKNPKGYTIPLDKRLAADGRGLQEVQINDNFAKLSEALYVAEQKAREAVAMRSKVQKEMLLKEKERKEQELRALAQKARSERIGVAPPAAVPVSERGSMDDTDIRVDYEYPREKEKNFPKETREEREERLQREKIREERRRERERERRLEAKDAAMGKKSKITRDRDRDISEKVALGLASTKQGTENEEADPFGLDQFLTEVKKGKKAMEKVGGGGTMRASGGSSTRDGYEGGSGRTRIGFERGH